MDGDTLIHTDLNAANLIVTPSGLRIVDWAFTTKAAAWVELAMLVQWLIGSGHSPEQAEEWLARFPAWHQINAKVLDEFASRNAAKWSTKADHTTVRWMHDLAVWTGRWSTYRRRNALTGRP
jgi:thiamine kinase-like enzyme